MSERKMATVRQIADVKPIEGADSICAYLVDGWKVIDTIGKYKTGDTVIYCEPDSWIPTEIAPFLSKGKEPREYKGVKGEKLQTIKLRGTLSQGLLIELSKVNNLVDLTGCRVPLALGDDVSELLNIQKWEQELSAQLRGFAKGNFPSFIPKTDQERIQNLKGVYVEYQQLDMEITEKVEGSSCTIYFNNDEFGVCSRNLELKETEDNTFWKVANQYNLRKNLYNLGLNIAIQGELIGTGIQGNIYNLHGFDLYVYDVFDIDKQEYFSHDDRLHLVEALGLKHVPLLTNNIHKNLSVSELLEYAEGTSLLNPNTQREGIVLKSFDGKHSLKVISNKYLLKQKD